MNLPRVVLLLALLLLPSAAAEDLLPALIARGDALDKQLKTKEALAVYLEAEKLAPKNSYVLQCIAKQFAESMIDVTTKNEKEALGAKAVEYARRSVAADPKSAKAHLALAICYGRIAPMLDNKTKIAYSKLVLEHAEQSLQLDASDSYAYHVLGAWNYEMASLNPVLRTIAGWIYGAFPAASYEKAVDYFKRAIELAPARVSHHVELGRTFAAMGKAELARLEISKGLALPSREKDDEETKQRGRAAMARL